MTGRSFWPSWTTDVVESPKQLSTWDDEAPWLMSTRHFWKVLIAAWLIVWACDLSSSYCDHCSCVSRAFFAPDEPVVVVVSVVVVEESPLSLPPPQPAAARSAMAAKAASSIVRRDFTSRLSALTVGWASS